MARKYAYQSGDDKVGRARLDDAKISYKKAYAVCRAIRNMKVDRALEYLDNVIEHKEIVPLFKFQGGGSHHAQAKMWGTHAGIWPEKAVRAVKDIVVSAAANAKHLHKVEKEALVIKAFFVGESGQIEHRRNYRAHGRVNKYDNQPCHIQIVCAPASEPVEPAKELQ